MLTNNKKIVYVSIAFVMILCGCSNSQSNSNVKTFGKDENTLTREEATAWIINENTRTDEELESLVEERRDNGIEIHERDNLVGELILNNNDNSVEYQIVNDSDIIYNGRTYYNLYKAATELDMPYESTTFINFILKTYNTSANEIFVMYSSDLDETEDDVIVSAYNEAKDLLGYYDIANKYGEDIYWDINIHERLDKNAATLYGCSKYILYQGSNDNVAIDMSKYDSGVVNEDNRINTENEDEEEITEDTNKETDEQIEETLEENVESTEENENEETESNTNN